MLCRKATDSNDRQRAALHVLDWAGCALAARGEPMARTLDRWSTSQATQGAICSSITGAPSTGAEQAAFVNGGLGNLLEMDDLHRASIMHAGDVVVPAALAQAQAVGASGDACLDAVLIGYEAAIRVGMAAATNGYSPWYNSATCGVFGSAMAAAHLLGLNDERCVDALGQAGMQASGVWQCRLEQTDSKQLATAHAARAGITAAALAAAGCAGARQILEGSLGFFKTYYPDADCDVVVHDPTSSWVLHDVSFKPWPACRHTHPLIHLALQLRDNVDVLNVKAIVADTYEAGQVFCNNPEPKTAAEARFSFQHCAAIALLYGPPTLDHFDDRSLVDEAVITLRNRISVQVDAGLTEAFPATMGASIAVTLSDGTVLRDTTRHAPGDPQLLMSGAAIREKFIANANHGGVARGDAERLADAVLHLPGQPDMVSLNRALAAIPPLQNMMGTTHG
ncbi:MmgE/PrpD family protein [Ahrensia sp. R2A130]|uniref:MmgE/PrpD family protein n=1 Tax=Ahrensia sp. R2A130 TaxID=744979 RepID=UPI001FFEEA80|nr:MmgE/PrpD family protein [Ahrensia sp. R2A130]